MSAAWRGLLARCIQISRKAVAIMPSPRGRRCPAGADEGDKLLASACKFPSSGRSGPTPQAGPERPQGGEPPTPRGRRGAEPALSATQR